MGGCLIDLKRKGYKVKATFHSLLIKNSPYSPKNVNRFLKTDKKDELAFNLTDSIA